MDFLEGILYVLWRGIAIGVIISAPMGPVGILCVQRTLDKGRQAGFFTGIGAAISDLFYCLITGFGLSFIEEFLEQNQNIIQIVGSVVLIIFGIYLFRSNPSRTIKRPGDIRISKKQNILSGFIFTVSNPLIIFLIIGLFARFNFLLPDIKFYHYIIGFGCIIIGALGWWWLVTFFVNKLRAHFNLRSMWLINKLTGGIIMAFGVVGIITSSIALANASEPRAIYINSCNSDISSLPEIDIEDADFIMEFRARNLHNAPGQKYHATDGGSKKVAHPGWSLIFIDTGTDTLRLSFSTCDDLYDPVKGPSMRVSATCGDSLMFNEDLLSGVDFFTGWNAFRIKRDGSEWTIETGNREYRYAGTVGLPGFIPVKAAFSPSPGAALEVDWFKTEFSGPVRSRRDFITDPDILASYMIRSTDPVEGIWEMFDRSLDEDFLRPGGKYQLLAVADYNGYDMIYLDGATKNPALWKRGMIKARLERTSFNNIYNMVWYDVEGHPVESECIAEISTPGLLAVQLPYLSSSFRLRKVNKSILKSESR